MWSNAIRFIIVFAALLATNFWEPVAGCWRTASRKAAATDFVALVLFALLITILQTVTNRVSQVNVRFLAMVNKVGGIVFACMTAAVLVSFANFTLHTAPLAEKYCHGGFNTDDPVFLEPDRQWARFMTFVSRGSMAKFSGPVEFDPRTKLEAYRARRAALEAQLAEGKGFGAESPPAR